MDPDEEIRKKRLVFGIIGSLLFVYLGWYLYSSAERQQILPANVVEAIGVVAMVFFGAAAIIGFNKYFSE